MLAISFPPIPVGSGQGWLQSNPVKPDKNRSRKVKISPVSKQYPGISQAADTIHLPTRCECRSTSKSAAVKCAPHRRIVQISCWSARLIRPIQVDSQLVILWQTVQRYARSALVMGTSRCKTPLHDIRSKLPIYQNSPILPMLFSWALCTKLVPMT